MNVDNYLLGETIRALRLNVNLSQESLAAALGVTKPAVSQWENGTYPKTEMIFKIAKFFGISVSSLITGQMDNESSRDYARRNYDLSNYDFDEDINEENVEELRTYYIHVRMVKEKFYDLMQKWAYDNLNNDEKEIFDIVHEYFKFDFNYYKSIFENINLSFFELMKAEKNCLRDLLDLINSSNELDKNWEISKIYDFKLDLKEKKVCDSGDMKVLELLIQNLAQQEKDCLLMHNIERIEKEKFNNQLKDSRFEYYKYIKVMLNNGANIMRVYNPINSFEDESILNVIEGKYVIKDLPENRNLDYLYKYSSSEARKLPVFTYWKNLSFEQYKSFIDLKRTELVKTIVNDKEQNPLKYYENLKNHFEGDFE